MEGKTSGTIPFSSKYNNLKSLKKNVSYQEKMLKKSKQAKI